MIAVLISLVCLASTPLLSADASFSSMNVQILERLRFVQPREREKGRLEMVDNKFPI
jgi:hypothetical protein